MEPSELAEIEEIKQLKARYFRLMDRKQWSEWRALLTDDCVMRYGPDLTVEGGDAVLEFVRGALDAAVSVHQGHMPEIELTGPTAARGVWGMSDVVEWSGDLRQNSLTGAGHYEDEYVKQDGHWRIRSFRITRLRVVPMFPRAGIDASAEKKT